MMKKTMVATVSFLSSILVLSGCGSSTSSTMSIVQSIESAAEKNGNWIMPALRYFSLQKVVRNKSIKLQKDPS